MILYRGQKDLAGLYLFLYFSKNEKIVHAQLKKQ